MPQDIIISRDSVCMGDDVFSHEISFQIEADESIAETLQRLTQMHYLPSIMGDEATWIVYGRQPLAVVAQQWSTPHFFVDPAARAIDLVDLSAEKQLNFVYWCQVDPHRVISSLEHNAPLPDRYGRDLQ